MLEHGFIYAKCDRCDQCAAVAFSCKQRGLCNSCDTKRGVEISAHLVDEVIPRVPIRQWVVTFPFDLRYLLAWHKKLRGQILSAVMRGLERHYVSQARAQEPAPAKAGPDETLNLLPFLSHREWTGRSD